MTPAFSRETLLKLSKGLNHATVRSMERREEDHLEEGTWAETVEELEKGWIWSADGEPLEGKVIARRFGLQQGSKLRVIDDCSCGGLNHSVGLAEKFQLHSIDLLAVLISHSFSLTAEGHHPSVAGRTCGRHKQFPVSSADIESFFESQFADQGKVHRRCSV